MIISTLITLLLVALCVGSPIDTPTRSINEASKIEKRTINWTPYINAASNNGLQVGFVGQNSVMTKDPPVSCMERYLVIFLFEWQGDRELRI